MARTGRPKLELRLEHEVKELKAAYRSSTDAVERRRIQAVWLLAEGKSRDEVRAVTAYAHTSLVGVIHRYNEAGFEGLKDKRHDNPGLEPLLNKAEQQELYAALQKPPEAGGVWSGKKVAAWMAQQLDKPVHVQRGCEYLERLGFSLQRPRPRHRQADQDAQENFKKTFLPSG